MQQGSLDGVDGASSLISCLGKEKITLLTLDITIPREGAEQNSALILMRK
jgi:hypothetical protein